MTKGLYIASSGLINCSKAMNVTGNNLTNAETAGFKKDTLVSKTFGEYLTDKMTTNNVSELGTISHGVTEGEIVTSYVPGVLRETGRPMDLAIEGEGFFTIRTQEGETCLTRNGQFCLNQNGILTDAAGNMVLGKNGPILIGQSDFSINDKGEIFADGVSCGTLLITCPADTATLTKEAGTLFASNNAQGNRGEQGVIKQGYLEAANVDIMEEMSNMMVLSRFYQSCGQLVKMMDRIMEKTVNEIARL